MRHKPAKLLHDILDAGQAIQQFNAGRNIEDYRNDLMLRSATERQFEIIGEAMNRLARLDEGLLKRIDGYQQIIAFRNIVAHGYDMLDHAIVWQVITDYLPRSLAQAKVILNEIEPTET